MGSGNVNCENDEPKSRGIQKRVQTRQNSGLKSRMVKYSGVRHLDGHLSDFRSIETMTIGKTL